MVRQRYDARQVPSKRSARRPSGRCSTSVGGALVVLELQGDLFFAPAEQLVRGVEDELGTARHIVLDARRTGRATASAAALLGPAPAGGGRRRCPPGARRRAGGPARRPDRRWRRLAGRRRVPRRRPGHRAGARTTSSTADLSDAAEPVPQLAVDGEGTLALAEVDILRELPPALLATVAARLETATYTAGEAIVREGEPADRLCFLVAGSATVRVDLDRDLGVGAGRTRRLRTFGPGTCFGESALLDGGRRTASVIADGPAVVRTLSVADLDGLGARHPELRERFLVAVGRNLSEMLQRAIGEIRALDA